MDRFFKKGEEIDRKFVMEILRPLELDLRINQLGDCKILRATRENDHAEIGATCDVLTPKRGKLFFNLQASYQSMELHPTKKPVLIRLEGGGAITEDEWNFRNKLAREQSTLLQKSAEEHDKIAGGRPITDEMIQKEREWAQRDTDLRRRLEDEFQEKLRKWKVERGM